MSAANLHPVDDLDLIDEPEEEDDICPRCDGTGDFNPVQGSMWICPECRGSGIVER